MLSDGATRRRYHDWFRSRRYAWAAAGPQLALRQAARAGSCVQRHTGREHEVVAHLLARRAEYFGF
eukprot:COSAG01_NODE_6614_length_3581_cov_1.071018_5_plen_66_part_00